MSSDIGDGEHGPAARPRGVGVDSALEELVRRWIEAWNERATEALVELAHPEIVLKPLRLRGLADSYEGHDGVREWMARITREGHDHRITASPTRILAPGRALAVGTVRVGAQITSPFTGIYEQRDGLMVFMSHYFTPASVLENIGVLEPETADP